MFCRNCGSKLDGGDIFCAKCGTKNDIEDNNKLEENKNELNISLGKAEDKNEREKALIDSIKSEKEDNTKLQGITVNHSEEEEKNFINTINDESNYNDIIKINTVNNQNNKTNMNNSNEENNRFINTNPVQNTNPNKGFLIGLIVIGVLQLGVSIAILVMHILSY